MPTLFCCVTKAQLARITISTDAADLDFAVVHGYLHDHAYWCKGIPADVFQRAVENSLCFNALVGGTQVGFARLVTDYATFGNLVDVFVLPGWRGRGIAKRVVRAVTEHPAATGLRRITLATRDAHGLYAQFGFGALEAPDVFMEIVRPGIYQSPSDTV